MKVSCKFVTIFVIIHLIDANEIELIQDPCNYLNITNITSESLDLNRISIQPMEFEQLIKGCTCDIMPCIRLCCVGDSTPNSSVCIQTDTFFVPTHGEDEKIKLAENRYRVLIGR